mmetsp:Transcript_9999/g.19190  ORF Transcript_9999/g.19190 Transcript_9999/m.19190 type:complete len:244 (-) Transcript_9999:170-901(-)
MMANIAVMSSTKVMSPEAMSLAPSQKRKAYMRNIMLWANPNTRPAITVARSRRRWAWSSAAAYRSRTAGCRLKAATVRTPRTAAPSVAPAAPPPSRPSSDPTSPMANFMFTAMAAPKRGKTASTASAICQLAQSAMPRPTKSENRFTAILPSWSPATLCTLLASVDSWSVRVPTRLSSRSNQPASWRTMLSKAAARRRRVSRSPTVASPCHCSTLAPTTATPSAAKHRHHTADSSLSFWASPA